MKYFIQLLLILFPLSFCQAEFDVPHVVVFGTAEKEVAPDELHWNLAIKTMGGTVTEVSRKHSDDVLSVLSYLKSSGLSADNVKTSRMQLNENIVPIVKTGKTSPLELNPLSCKPSCFNSW